MSTEMTKEERDKEIKLKTSASMRRDVERLFLHAFSYNMMLSNDALSGSNDFVHIITTDRLQGKLSNE
jgi:hypothetical protein